MIASGFSWFHLVPGIEDGSLFPFAHDHGYQFVSAWFVCFVILAGALAARGALQRATARQGLERYYADETLTVRTTAEIVVGGVIGFMNDMLAKDDVRRFLPLVGGLFIYILTCNLMALVPGMQPPTDSINANIGMALLVVVTYWIVGLSRDAKSFFAHLTGPVLALVPLILPLELLTMLIIRPATLSVRLTGNIFGDHTVFNIMSGLVPLVVPVPFLALGTLVAFIQAFVFSLLTTIYISLALPHGDHDDHGHDAHHH